MSFDTKLMKDEECELVDSTKYRGLIGLWYPKGTNIETVVCADSDHVGGYVDRKSTSGISTFVGCCLTSWFLKKQTALAISTTETEYREKLERIVAREEVVTSLPPPPSINHLHLISTMMMMEITKGSRVQKIKLTIISPRQLFVNISSDEGVTPTPSPTTTSSSPTPPNAPSKTISTNQTSSSQENTSSFFQSKLQISPPSSNEPTSAHPLNPLLDNILKVPPRPLNPQPLQTHPSLDITLSFSPITPFDHIHDTSSPPSPPNLNHLS
nr:uncharacterized mitochondrial protein AtMg00810-like [Tanacetum cinerariifolium]